MGRLRMAVIGVGHLGKEHARILSTLPEVELVGVADLNAEQARAVAERCGTRTFTDYRPLLGGIDAAVVAVPTTYHHSVASDCLQNGVSLLVEKPLAITAEQASDLVEQARRRGTVLQVGHIERFNPAFEEWQRRSREPRLISAQRLGPFSGRSTDVGVVHDLMIHDLDLVLALTRASVQVTDASGVSLLGGHEDVATVQLTFADGCVANLTASRVHPVPLRRMLIAADGTQASLDFARRHLTVTRSGGESSEHEANGEDQLTRELRDFVHCVVTRDRPRVSGEDGRDALLLATRIVETIRRKSTSSPALAPLPRAA